MKASIVYVYNSFNDPLFQATLWLYLKKEAKNERFEFHLITYEQEEYQIPQREVAEIKANLIAQNIHWTPLVWHSGKYKLFKKVYDLLVASVLVLKIKHQFKPKTIISLGTVAGSFAYILSRAFGLKNYIYQFERHSEFLADFGIWSHSSLSFRLLHYLETLSGKNSEFLATGTNHMVERLRQEGTNAKVFLLPSCVEDEKFRFDQNARDCIRNKLNIQEKKVILYMGKFGGIYFSIEQMAKFFSDWYQLDSTFFFLILTPQDKEEITKKMLDLGLPSTSLHVDIAQHTEIPTYLSAADLGLVAVPSHPSQKFRSPIKVGEYLCCGLPYVVGKGVSEDDRVALEKNVGVVLGSYDLVGIKESLDQINELLSEEPIGRRTRCRDAGVEYRGFSELSKTGESVFNELYNF